MRAREGLPEGPSVTRDSIHGVAVKHEQPSSVKVWFIRLSTRCTKLRCRFVENDRVPLQELSERFVRSINYDVLLELG